MSSSAQSFLTAAETAYQAVVDQMSAGKLTVEYEIRGRRVRKSDPVMALRLLREEITHWSRVVARSSRSPFRLAKLSSPKGSS